VRKIRLYLAQSLALFFGPLTLSNVHHGTHELNNVAVWAENRVAYQMDISDLAARTNDSVFQLELRLLRPYYVAYFPDLGMIISMDAFKECFESRLSSVRVKT
jgi:hypothetical protein